MFGELMKNSYLCSVEIKIGKGASARSIRLELPHFTMVGATTRPGMLTAPLRDRFGVIQRLEYYTVEELEKIIIRSAGMLSVQIEPEGARMIAMRSRGTPRLANRFLKRVRDFAQVRYDGVITEAVARETLDLLNVDSLGLDSTDRALLTRLLEDFGGGPVGMETLAVSMGEDNGTIEDLVEPYLIQAGLLARTSRGRIATRKAYEHMGLPYPDR
jgi:Holliday junction DNA helicase RuvB